MTLCACQTSRQVSQSITVKEKLIKDKVSYKDTVLVAPKANVTVVVPLDTLVKTSKTDKVGFRHPIRVDDFVKSVPIKPKVYTATKGHAKATITPVGNTIKFDCECDTLAIKAKLRESFKTEFKGETNTKVAAVVKQRGVSWFKLILYLIIALIIGFVAGTVVNLFKPIKPLTNLINTIHNGITKHKV